MIRTGSRSATLYRDVSIIGLSIIVAAILIESNAIDTILISAGETQLLASFVAGMFFTSVFTTAPAIAALGEISLVAPLWQVAAVGAAGSVVGDLLIFWFFRDHFAGHVVEILQERGVMRRLRKILRFKFMKWFPFLLGGMILASPLPDELGIMILGFTRMKPRWFMLMSYSFNFLGIMLIGLAARAFVA